jgi:hypothetical protein
VVGLGGAKAFPFSGKPPEPDGDDGGHRIQFARTTRRELCGWSR